jgi:hypothetical protein
MLAYVITLHTAMKFSTWRRHLLRGQLASHVLIMLSGELEYEIKDGISPDMLAGGLIGEEGFICSIRGDGISYARPCDVYAFKHTKVAALSMDSLNRIHIKSPDLGWNLYCCIVKVRVNR